MIKILNIILISLTLSSCSFFKEKPTEALLGALLAPPEDFINEIIVPEFISRAPDDLSDECVPLKNVPIGKNYARCQLAFKFLLEHDDATHVDYVSLRKSIDLFNIELQAYISVFSDIVKK